MSDDKQENIEIQVSIDFGNYYSLEEPQNTIRELDIMRGVSRTAAQHIAYLTDMHQSGNIKELSEVSEVILLLSRLSLAFTEKAEFLSNDLFLRLKKENEDA